MKSIGTWLGAALVGGVGMVGVQSATAADPTNAELDQKIKVLERKLEVADEAAAAKAKDAVKVTAGKEGFSISSADKGFQLKLRGIIQADGRFYLDDNDKKATDSFVLRRVRPIIEGKFYNDFGFRFTPDFGNGQTVIQDAYGEYTPTPEFGIRAGKFKTPVGLERLQSAPDVEFIERGAPTAIAPNRDIGIEVLGDVASGTVQYAAGIFNGVQNGGSADADTNDDKDFAGRLFFHPFRPAEIAELANLGLGVGFSYGKQTGATNAPNLATYKSPGQQTFFSYKNSTNVNGIAFADGNNTRIAPQGYYYIGPVGVLGEYIVSQQEVSNGKKSGTIDSSAWLLEASWVLTGEDASYKGVTPLFNYGNGHIGAVELVGRLHNLTIDDSAFPTYADPKKAAKEANGWGVGLNWYLNKNVKVSLDYDQTSFDGGASEKKGKTVVVADRPDEKVVFSRIQFAF